MDSEQIRKQDRRTMRNVKKINRLTSHSPAQMDSYKKVFEVYDADKDGVINLQELEVMVTSLQGGNVDKGTVKRMMDEVDLNGDGNIDFDEFVYLMTRILDNDDPEIEIKEVFEFFDKEKKGFINRDQVQEMFVQLGIEMKESELDDVMQLLDVNKDGNIDFEEFRIAYIEYNLKGILQAQNA